MADATLTVTMTIDPSPLQTGLAVVIRQVRLLYGLQLVCERFAVEAAPDA